MRIRTWGRAEPTVAADGRLKLIDGHLRRDLAPDLDVDMEVLDVDDAEARRLLLSIDPLAALAGQQDQLHIRLMELTPTASDELQAAWHAATRAYQQAVEQSQPPAADPLPDRFYALITCRDERQQVEILTRFQEEGLDCKAIIG